MESDVVTRIRFHSGTRLCCLPIAGPGASTILRGAIFISGYVVCLVNFVVAKKKPRSSSSYSGMPAVSNLGGLAFDRIEPAGI